MRPFATLCSLALAASLNASAGELEALLKPTTVSLDKATFTSLTTAQAVAKCNAPIISAILSDGVFRGGTAISGKLQFQVGPSFSVNADTIVSWLTAVSGELSVRRGADATVWKLRQFNFLNQAARANCNRTTRRLSLFLPVVLTAEHQPEVHAFLVVKGVLEADRITWTSLLFSFEDLVASAFPNSPRIERVVGAPAGAPATPPSR